MKALPLSIAGLVWASVVTAGFAANGPAATPPLPNSGNPAGGPRIQFETQVYDFGKVAAGETIQHTFTASNAGNATLLITGVRPSCGCTTAGAWTKEIEPGKTGVIPVQINSANLRGMVQKTVTVSSNDKSQPMTVLRLQGTIWRPIECNPPVAWMKLSPDLAATAQSVIHITNQMDQPLTLSPPQSSNKYFTGALKTLQAGKEFELTVTVVPPLPPGPVMGSMRIETSAASMPTLTIPITVIAPTPAVVVRPPAINLAGAAPNQILSRSVLIQATTPQPLAVFDPSVNAKGINVEIKEVLPKSRYNLTLAFPPGFQIPPGQQLELSVKTSHPLYPVIKVPITQSGASAAVTARKE